MDHDDRAGDGPAAAAILGAELDAPMTGNTIYLTGPVGGGEIVPWDGADGVATARLPSSALLDGTWSIRGDLSCIV